MTPTPTTTKTPTPSPSQTRTPTPSPRQTRTPTPSPSQTRTPTPSPSPSASSTPTLTPSRTPSPTPSGTVTPTPSKTPTPTPIGTITPRPTRTPTPTPNPSATPTPTPTRTDVDMYLYANFERTRDKDVFYRPVNSSPFECSVQLSALFLLEDNQPSLASSFFAKYSTDKGATKTTFNLVTGEQLTFARSFPRTHTIDVYLYTFDELTTPSRTFTLSAVFINSTPAAQFVAYPGLVLNETTGEITQLTSSNYTQTSGVYFYGEGHTEVIYLSAALPQPSSQATWFVGNNLNELDTSLYSVFSTENPNISKAILPSYPFQESSIPITLVLKNNQTPTVSSPFYYDDITGEKKIYSFVTSTLDVNNNINPTNTRFKDNIKIKPYPKPDNFVFMSPFESTVITLPSDYNLKTFTGRVSSLNNISIFMSQLTSTTWTLSTTQDSFSTQGNWSYQTPILRGINAYEFPLTYEQSYTETPPILKVSSTNNTLITLSVSSSIILGLNQPPYDWKPRPEVLTFQDVAVVLPLPSIKVFSLNYYNLLQQKTINENNIENVGTEFYIDSSNIDTSHVISSITINATNSPNTLSLTGNNIFEPFYIDFVSTGIQTLTATTTLKSQEGTSTVINIFPNIVETLLEFDNTKQGTSYYKSEFTPLSLSLTSAPLLSPNEWTVEDNINNSISLLFNSIDEIKRSLFRYKQNSFMYGWLGNNKRTWSDLECAENNTEKLSWTDNSRDPELSQFTQDEGGFPLFWNQQRCENVAKDPSCFQKYCIEWKWSKRRRRPASINTTWALAEKTGTYAKKWKFEPCEIDSTPLNCDKGSWHFSTVDPEYFPIPFCSSNESCEIQSCVKLPQNKLLIAYKTEINIMSNEYEPLLLSRRGIADEIFNFASIEGIALNKNKTKLYVVDSLLSKVCVYSFKNNTLQLVSSWGRFGFVSDVYGFNKPNDIYVDPASVRVIVTDTGNACVKVYSSVGRYLNTIVIDEFAVNPPLGVCVDSQNYLHVLTSNSVIVLDWNGNFNFKYEFPTTISPKKITSSYNQEAVYVSHNLGVIKYFRTGAFFEHVLNNQTCAKGKVLTNYNGLYQDEMRNLFVAVNDKVLKIPDRMKIDIYNTVPLTQIYWSIMQLLIHKEEYIQPWVYLKAFHRLWDNIELIRTFLPYKQDKNQAYLKPSYNKEDITIGHNEIVTNSVINRCINQLWSNIETLMLYFES